MKLLLLFAVCSGLCFATTCTSQGATSQPSNTIGTWSCGHIPVFSDDVVIATPVMLTGDLVANTITYHGATAQLTTDGAAPHLVQTYLSGAQSSVEYGCSAVSSSCSTPYVIDTCVNSSAGNEVTFSATGLSNTQYVLAHYLNVAPYADVQVRLCHTIFTPGNGGAVYHYGLSGLDGSTWNVSTTKIVGGFNGFRIAWLGNLIMTNVSATGLSGNMVTLPNHMAGSCTLTNLTFINPAADNGYMFYSSASENPNCTITGSAMETDTTGYYDSSFIQKAATNVNNNIAYSHVVESSSARNATYGVSGVFGNSTTQGLITHNAIEGFGYVLWGIDYNVSSNNVFYVKSTDTATQGGIFLFGSGCPFSSTGDIAGVDGGADPGVIGIFTSNNGSGGEYPCPIFHNDTIYMGYPTTLPGGYGMDFNEDPIGGSHTTSFYDSIVVGSNSQIADNDRHNTFLTNGTGGVGVYNNDTYAVATGGSPYTRCLACNSADNFDNGTVPHPNAIYGDKTVNPQFVSPNRSWSACDAILGGVGTLANVFQTVMFNRWTGAAPQYTPSQMVDCMRSGFNIMNSVLATASSTGSYVGAMPYVGVATGTAISGNPRILGSVH